MGSSAWSTVNSATLLATVPLVYKTKNSKSLPLPLLVMGVVSGFLWVVCGLMLWDPWITFPNVFALAVCIYTCYLCYIFPATEGSPAKCDVEPVYAEEDQPLLSHDDVEKQVQKH